MPLFDFACNRCGFEFEALMGRSEAPPTCPRCGHGDVTKGLSAPRLGKPTTQRAPTGDGGHHDCIGNRAAAARARGKSSCC